MTGRALRALRVVLTVCWTLLMLWCAYGAFQDGEGMLTCDALAFALAPWLISRD